MMVTLTKLTVSWQIDTDDGRGWFTAPGDYPIAGIRSAYPRQCRALQNPGDSVTFEDTKGHFARGAGWRRIIARRQKRSGRS